MNKNDTKRNERKPKLNLNMIKEYKVHEETELLTFLLSKYPNLSRNNVKNLLSNHQVAVDGAPVSQFNFKLVKDDVVIDKNFITSKAAGTTIDFALTVIKKFISPAKAKEVAKQICYKYWK